MGSTAGAPCEEDQCTNRLVGAVTIIVSAIYDDTPNCFFMPCRKSVLQYSVQHHIQKFSISEQRGDVILGFQSLECPFPAFSGPDSPSLFKSQANMLVEQYENKRQAQPLPLGHHCMIGFISARANEVLSWRVLTPYSIQKRRVNIDILLFSPGILNNRGLF